MYQNTVGIDEMNYLHANNGGLLNVGFTFSNTKFMAVGVFHVIEYLN